MGEVLAKGKIIELAGIKGRGIRSGSLHSLLENKEGERTDCVTKYGCGEGLVGRGSIAIN